jgi:hypothetical protein
MLLLGTTGSTFAGKQITLQQSRQRQQQQRRLPVAAASSNEPPQAPLKGSKGGSSLEEVRF